MKAPPERGISFIMSKKLIETIAVIIFIHISHHHQCKAFNLWTEGSTHLIGPPDSKFGYSVALWSDLNGDKRIVVGAPRGQNHTKSGADGSQLGNVYLCDLRGQCIVDERLPFVDDKYYSKESLKVGYMQKYGMGFGESLAALNEKESPLTVCAPRYSMFIDKTLQPRGACFLVKDREHEPSVIIPFERKEPKPDTVQYALIGFSVALVEEPPLVVMGGPNAFFGEGMTVTNPSEGGGRGSTTRLKKRKEITDAYEGWQVAQGRFDGTNTTIAVSVVNFRNVGKVKFYPNQLEPYFTNSENYLHEIMGYEVGSKFGYSLGVGDFDGDKVDDLLVGSPWASVTKPRALADAGRVYVYYSPLDMQKEGKPFKELMGSFAWGKFGFSTAGLGDINKDGCDDAAIGAPYGGENGEGIVYIFNGSPHGLLTEPTQVLKPADFDGGMRGFGFSLRGGSDMDGNGYPDVVISSVDSNSAILLRSAPVITLSGGVNLPEEAMDTNNDCMFELPGNKRVKGICFDLEFELWYRSFNFAEDIDVELRMVLDDQPDPPKFVFRVNNAVRYTTEVTIGNSERKAKTSAIKIFAKSDRSLIGKPVKVSVSVGLNYPAKLPDASGILTVPPVLDPLSSTSFSTSRILECADNTTCFSRPDMSIHAYETELVVGNAELNLPVLVESRHDPAYQVEVVVNHPEVIRYQRVEGPGLIPQCFYERLIGTSYTKFKCVFPQIETNEKVNFTLIFEQYPSALMDYLKKKPKMEINLRVQSDSVDTDERDNEYTSKVEVTKEAILYTQGESLPERLAVKVNETLSWDEIRRAMPPNNMTFSPDQLGPKVTQRFSLTNRGPSPVRGTKLRLQLALYSGDKRALYIQEEPVTSENIICSWTNLIDPWHMKAPPTEKLTEAPLSTKARKRRRVNNDLESVPGDSPSKAALSVDSRTSGSLSDTHSEEKIQKQRLHSRVPQDRGAYPQHSREVDGHTRRTRSLWDSDRPSYLDCKRRDCEFLCEVNQLTEGERASIVVTGYAIIATLDRIQNTKIAMKSIITAEADRKDAQLINQYSTVTTFITLFKSAESGLSAVPFWLLLLAVIGSILLILLMVLLLWKAGFFKRRRPPTKAAANRKTLLTSDYPAPECDPLDNPSMDED